MFLVYATMATAIAGATSNPPHVLFLLSDDLGWSNIGFHNSGELLRYHALPARALECVYFCFVCAVRALECVYFCFVCAVRVRIGLFQWIIATNAIRYIIEKT